MLKQSSRVFIDNGIKYKRDGDSITISCQNDEGDCIIRVADTGLGMVQEDLNHIFERFYRSGQKQVKGSGLGLAIMKNIGERHHIRIRLQSEWQKGTTIRFEVPQTEEHHLYQNIS